MTLLIPQHNWSGNAWSHFENIVVVENDFKLVRAFMHEFEDLKAHSLSQAKPTMRSAATGRVRSDPVVSVGARSPFSALVGGIAFEAGQHRTDQIVTCPDAHDDGREDMDAHADLQCD